MRTHLRPWAQCASEPRQTERRRRRMKRKIKRKSLSCAHSEWNTYIKMKRMHVIVFSVERFSRVRCPKLRGKYRHHVPNGAHKCFCQFLVSFSIHTDEKQPKKHILDIVRYHEIQRARWSSRRTWHDVRGGTEREREGKSECAKRKKGNPLDIVGVEDERVMVLHALT